ncbi:MAG: OsmC family protein [Anaerolineales bacterium]|nr:OsmC family protein [Anaerolineales bacterium]
MAQATVTWLKNKQFVGVDSSRHSVVLSAQDEANGIGCKPSEMLLIALASCASVDVVEILAKKRLTLSGLEVAVTGEQDPTPPWTFRRIHLTYRLRGADLTPAAVEQAIRLSEEKYCSVAATLRGVATITWEYHLETPAAEPALAAA